MNFINRIKNLLFGNKTENNIENSVLDKVDELKEEIKDKVVEGITNSLHHDNTNAETFMNLMNRLGLQEKLDNNMKEKLANGDITNEELKSCIETYKEEIISKIKAGATETKE